MQDLWRDCSPYRGTIKRVGQYKSRVPLQLIFNCLIIGLGSKSAFNWSNTLPFFKKSRRLRIKKNAERIYYALTKSVQINRVKVIYFIICEKKAQAIKNCRKSSCR